MITKALRHGLSAVLAATLVLPGVASAAETRSGNALPAKTALTRTKAPVRGVRSNALQLIPIIAIVAGIATVTWVVVDNGNNDSPG